MLLHHFLKSFFPGSIQPIDWLKRPWLIVSIGLHSLLLLLPLPASPPESVTETVSLIETPPAPPEIPASPSLQPSVQPQLLPSPTPAVPVNSIPAPVPPSVIPSPSPATPTPSIAPTPQISPIPASPTPAVVESPPPSPATSPTPDVAVSPSPTPTPELAATPADYLADFPHIASATAGCHNSDECWRSTDTQWRSVAGTLRENLQAQGYTVAEMPIADDIGRRVYQIEKPGQQTFYLNLISTFEGTLYFITEAPMSAEEINQLTGNEG